MNKIKGSLNIITGCGSGLGLSTLKWFLKNESGPILCIDRSFNVEETIPSDQRSKLLIKTHDTFDEKQTEASIEEFVSKYGSIDNVINVAGVSLAFLLISKKSQSIYESKHVDDLVKFNTVGTFNVIRLSSKFMINNCLKSNEERAKSKCIINTSCISTSAPTLGQTFYAGSKAAIDSMTLSVARELSPFNIRCNTINVGYFDTKLLRSSDQKIMDYIEKQIALCPKRLGHPDEFAHLVTTIVENQMINGACIKIDGGSKELIV